jgi:hypothetical protein
MEANELVFLSDDLAQQYKEIPVDLAHQLDSHYDTLMSAESMRKAPFPPHRNRGVSIKVEKPQVVVIVHAVRVKGTVEIHGINIRPRNDDQQEDYLAQQEVYCPFCKAVRGEPCKAPNGTVLTYVGTRSWRRRTHADRREFQQTGVDPSTRNAKSKSNALFASGIRSEVSGDMDPSWLAVVEEYRSAFSDHAMADGLIGAAVRVLEKHHPDLLWKPRDFLNFMHEQVSGPHADRGRLIMRSLATAHRLGVVDAQQFAYYQRSGPKAYADFAGLDFAPHPLGGFVAVRGLKDL